MSPEETGWGRLSEPTPRGRYEHARTWEKRNQQRARFVGKIRREGGHWLWDGRMVRKDGRTYPMHAYRVIGGGRDARRQVMAFRHLVAEFFPEWADRVPQRTAPTCGEDRCISPWHRGNNLVTRQTITAEQALAIFRLKGEQEAVGVASQFGISHEQVLAIWRGRSWRSVTGLPPHKPTRKVYPDEVVYEVLARRGQGSSRAVAAEVGVSYRFVLEVWAGNRKPRSLSQ